MRTRLFVSLAVMVVLPLAACGGSSKPASSPTTPSTQILEKAAKDPSVSAKMICADEAQKDIYESATGVKTIAPFKPTWVDHVYSCKYVYPNGAVMTLSVKELSTDAETTAYYNMLGEKLHKTDKQIGLPIAFQAADGSVVARKDNKVLTIDVTKLPASFGVPAASRGDVAINVAATILGCWTGA